MSHTLDDLPALLADHQPVIVITQDSEQIMQQLRAVLERSIANLALVIPGAFGGGAINTEQQDQLWDNTQTALQQHQDTALLITDLSAMSPEACNAALQMMVTRRYPNGIAVPDATWIVATSVAPLNTIHEIITIAPQKP